MRGLGCEFENKTRRGMSFDSFSPQVSINGIFAAKSGHRTKRKKYNGPAWCAELLIENSKSRVDFRSKA